MSKDTSSASLKAWPFHGILGDNGTWALLESILDDEEEHLDWIEAQLGQMGGQICLAEQLEGE